jgi:dihydrofolate reductase
MSATINIIAAFERNRGLAKNGRLPWGVIPDDVKYFNDKVKGHVVVMGRKTYDQIGQKPLTTSKNIVVTRQKGMSQDGFTFVGSIEDALREARNCEASGEVFVVGGGEIYKLALPYTDRLYLTLVDGNYPNVDTYFPDYSMFKKEISSDSRSGGGNKYSFVVLKK